jgi:hypothetical protein
VELLALRLVLPPLLVVLASLAQRRLGDRAGGLLVGLPLTSGTYLLLLVPTHGASAAADAAVGVLAGQVAVVALCATYAWSAVRGGPARALGAALVAWGLAAAAAGALPNAGVVVGAFVLLATVVLRRWPAGSRPARAPQTAPLWSVLLVRAAAATAVVVGLSAATSALGPRLGGLVAAAPLVVLVVAPSTHRRDGTAAVRALLHGVVRGSVAATGLTLALLIGLVAGA